MRDIKKALTPCPMCKGTRQMTPNEQGVTVCQYCKGLGFLLDVTDEKTVKKRYNRDDALNYIGSRCGVSGIDIMFVLELDKEYRRSIGLED